MPRNFLEGAAHPPRDLRASMRPRQMPRNFAARMSTKVTRCIGFNEAAADAAEFSAIGAAEFKRTNRLQ